jgi:hypothetical protein
MVLLKRGKNDGIAVYAPKETILKEVATKIEYVKPAFFYLVRELFDTPRRAPGTHWIGGWVDPQSRSERCGEKKTLIPAGNRTPVVQPVAHCYTD